MSATNGRRNGRSAADRQEQAAQALALRRQGVPYAEIGVQLDVSADTAARRVHTALAELVAEESELLRAQEEDRLDDVLRDLYSLRRDASTTIEQRIKINNAIVSVSRQRAKLLGLEAPVKQIHALEWGNNADQN